MTVLYKAGEIENYYGFRISSPENSSRKMAKTGFTIGSGDIRRRSHRNRKRCFVVKTVKGNYRALSVLIATDENSGCTKKHK